MQELEATLSNLYDNGLRTLVIAHSVQGPEWWQRHQAKYRRVEDMRESTASEGHPSKCRKSCKDKCDKCSSGNPKECLWRGLCGAPSCEKCAADDKGNCLTACEKCVAHNFYEAVEKDAQLVYLGLNGQEDQLQLLVPETIEDLVKAGVNVWMITGDKLAAAKSIGMACNLIDPDMLPNTSGNCAIHKTKMDRMCIQCKVPVCNACSEPHTQLGHSIDLSAQVLEIVKTEEDRRHNEQANLKQICNMASDARLMEITTTWATANSSETQFGILFDLFDADASGEMDDVELKACLSGKPLGLASVVTALRLRATSALAL